MTDASDEVRSITSSERLVVVGGVGLAVASVVPWYRPDELAFDATRTNGWEEPDAILSQMATILGVVLAVVVLAANRTRDRPTAGTLSWGTLLTTGGAVVFGLVALKYCLNMENTTVGVYLALVAALTQLYGAYVTRVDEWSMHVPAGPATPAGDQRPPPAPPLPAPLTVGQPLAPAQRPPPGPDTPTVPAPAPAPPGARSWPETAYFLSAWSRSAEVIEPAATAYRRAFAADPARQARLRAELLALLDPTRGEAERHALLAAHAPHWARWSAHGVFDRLARALVTPSAQ